MTGSTALAGGKVWLGGWQTKGKYSTKSIRSSLSRLDLLSFRVGFKQVGSGHELWIYKPRIQGQGEGFPISLEPVWKRRS